MKILKKLLILVVFVAISISACSTQAEPTNTPKPTAEPTNTPKPTNTPGLNAETSRDLSTPEKMLVGHWGKVNSADGSIYENEDLMFGELNEDGEGKLFFRSDSEDYTSHTYQIKSVEEDTVKFTIKKGDQKIIVTMHLSEDGQFIKFDDMWWAKEDLWPQKWKCQYIDSQTEP